MTEAIVRAGTAIENTRIVKWRDLEKGPRIFASFAIEIKSNLLVIKLIVVDTREGYPLYILAEFRDDLEISFF